MLYTPSFFAMALANFFTISSFAAFFLFPLFISRHNGSQMDIGIVMGTFGLSSVLCRPWISEMIDRAGRKKSFTFGSLIMSALPLAYLCFHGDLSRFYLPLLVVRTIHGVGLALCITAAFTYAADIIPRHRLNEGIGIFGVSGLSGLAFGPVFAEFVIRHFGFDLFFVTAAAMAALGFLAHLPLRESLVSAATGVSGSFFSLFHSRKVLTVTLTALLFGFGTAASSGFVSPFASERSLAFISLFYLCYSVAAILTRLFGGRLADRVGERRVIPYALLLMGVGLILLVFLSGSVTLAISGLMTGCGHGFLYPSLNALAIRNEATQVRGKITGIFTGSIDAGAFAGSLILGYIGEWHGFQALFLTSGLALILGLGVFKVFGRHSG